MHVDGEQQQQQDCASEAPGCGLFSQQQYLACEHHLVQRRQLWWGQQLGQQQPQQQPAAQQHPLKSALPAAAPAQATPVRAQAGLAQKEDAGTTDAMMQDCDSGDVLMAGAALAADAAGVALQQLPEASSGCCVCLYGSAAVKSLERLKLEGFGSV